MLPEERQTIAELKSIRSLLIRALALAADATEQEVRDAPMGCAVAARRRSDETRAALRGMLDAIGEVQIWEARQHAEALLNALKPEA